MSSPIDRLDELPPLPRRTPTPRRTGRYVLLLVTLLLVANAVVGERGLDAWLEIRPDPDGSHRFALMAHPRAADAIRPIVSFALWRRSHYPAALTRVLVRDHEILLAAGLTEAGFEPAGATCRMIKHLAIRLAAEVPSAALDRATS